MKMAFITETMLRKFAVTDASSKFSVCDLIMFRSSQVTCRRGTSH